MQLYKVVINLFFRTIPFGFGIILYKYYYVKYKMYIYNKSV